jgi:hypothetical protein
MTGRAKVDSTEKACALSARYAFPLGSEVALDGNPICFASSLVDSGVPFTASIGNDFERLDFSNDSNDSFFEATLPFIDDVLLRRKKLLALLRKLGIERLVAQSGRK